MGIFGIRCIAEALTENGYGDLAIKLFEQDTYPSFGDIIKRGATTLWEYWGEPEIDKNDGPRSLNHPMFGGFDIWFFEGLGGIKPDVDFPGFKRFYLKPNMISGINEVKVVYKSIYGNISSHWCKKGDFIDFHCSVPVNTEAVLILPVSQNQTLLESGMSLDEVEDIKFKQEKDKIILTLPSGRFSFFLQNRLDFFHS